MSKKATSIVSYITIIGWLIAFLAGDKEEAKFYLNQSLIVELGSVAVALLHKVIGRGILGIVCSILGLIFTILWFMGIYHAIKQDDKALPLIGDIEIIK